MDFYGIDYNTIFSYVKDHWPWALPYIQFIMYVTPFVLFASGKIANVMPTPGYQITLFSDATLSGKLNSRWFGVIDRFVQSGNQAIILMNFILSSRIYVVLYHILGALGNRVKKADAQSGLPKTIVSPMPQPKSNPDEAPVVTADNLTAEQIQTRAKFLSDQLASANSKTLRNVAAQKVVQLDTPPVKPKTEDTQDGQTRSVS